MPLSHTMYMPQIKIGVLTLVQSKAPPVSLYIGQGRDYQTGHDVISKTQRDYGKLYSLTLILLYHKKSIMRGFIFYFFHIHIVNTDLISA